MSTLRKIELEVDELDYEAIQKAFAVKQGNRFGGDSTILPDGDGNIQGRMVGEICRGWLDMLGLWKGQ